MSDKMRIQHLGHAGFIVNAAEKKILIDPFFHGAFLGSWFPYPDNSQFEQELLDQQFDYLYISHTHEDHCDVKFLEKFKRNIKVICPNYRSRALELKLISLGYTDLILLKHKESYTDKLTGFKMAMYLDTSHKEDSGILFDDNETTFLNLNDCNTTLADLPTDVTVLAAQYSGAMWYPNAYFYNKQTEESKTQTVIFELMETLYRKIAHINPKHYIPCAGPPCFLDPLLNKFNDREKTIFPTWDIVQNRFSQRYPNLQVAPMLAGDIFVDNHIEPGDFDLPTKILPYAQSRIHEWSISNKGASVKTIDVVDYFDKLRKNNIHIFDENITFRLSCGINGWTIKLGKNTFIVKEGRHAEKGYEFFVPPWIMRDILDGKTGWEEALLSMRVSIERNPDVYDVKLMGLLRYGNQPKQTLQMVKDTKSNTMITRDGVTFQQFCPHAGEDLSNAEIKDGIITCPRHHWKWDVKTGECLKGGTLKLKCGESCK